jgi:hypothetical protein
MRRMTPATCALPAIHTSGKSIASDMLPAALSLPSPDSYALGGVWVLGIGIVTCCFPISIPGVGAAESKIVTDIVSPS